jgi:hypothetical protein
LVKLSAEAKLIADSIKQVGELSGVRSLLDKTSQSSGIGVASSALEEFIKPLRGLHKFVQRALFVGGYLADVVLTTAQ